MDKLLVLISYLLATLVIVESWGVPRGQYHTDYSMWKKVNSSSREFKNLVTGVATSPRCVTRNGSKIRCFYATTKHTVGYTVISSGKVEGTWDYGGSVYHQPQIVEYGYSGHFVFFMNKDHKIVCVGVETGTSYDHKPTPLPLGDYAEVPTCVPLQDHTEVFCVARGNDGNARVLRFRNSKWEPALSIGENPNSPVGCVANPVARLIQCWASYGHNNVFAERWWSLKGEVITERWRSFGEHSRGRPCVRHVGAIAFPRALSSDHDYMVDPFGYFNGHLYSEPDCASADSRTYDCFAYTDEKGLQRNSQYLGILYVRNTSGWVKYPGDYHGNPSCLYLTRDRKYHCFMTSTDNTLVEGILGVVRQGRSEVAI